MSSIKFVFILWIGFFMLLLNISAQKAPLFKGKSDQDLQPDSTQCRRKYFACRISSQMPIIDGSLSDACWETANWSQEFVQQSPNEGQNASQKTQMVILYDDKNIYVAIKAFDNEPDKIHKYAGKRDEISGDAVGICFDSYHDRSTGFEFAITASGSKIDQTLNNYGWGDNTWNAVWYGETQILDSLWTAEMQIPLSQLRYSGEDELIWGLHAWRWLDRNMEESQWNLIPKNNNGFVLNFGELHGISHLKKARRIEIQPYLLGKNVFSQKEENNPYQKGYEINGTMGLDAKIGVSSDFTIDLTINPDFGQVEADPSQMNLTAYESFFQEKRPFFLEGKSIFEYYIGGNQVFYSRRIGHSPSFTPSTSENEYMKMPSGTKIIDAIKFSGKNKRGLSIGILQSLTNEEKAKISDGTQERKETVEPYTNYLICRIQKDFNKGNTKLGGIATSSHRFIHDEQLNFLNKAAYTGGFDFIHYIKNRSYYLELKGLLSMVEGDTSAIQDIQNSYVHYYNRADASHLNYDPNLKKINGNTGSISIGKAGTGDWQFVETFNFISPGLEMNDLGFQNYADLLWNYTRLSYRKTSPFSIFREFYASFRHDARWDFEGNLTYNSLVSTFSGQFKNKWGFYSFLRHNFPAIDTRFLRGGPEMKQDGYNQAYFSINSDWTKKFSLNIGSSIGISDIRSSVYKSLDFGLEARLSNRLKTELYVEYSQYFNRMQYITMKEQAQDKYYLLSEFDQKTFRITLRMNYNVSPDFSIQFYSSPFFTQGNYNNFAQANDTRSTEFQNRFSAFPQSAIAYNGETNEFNILDNNNIITLSQPNFRFVEFKSNLVLRYEYQPGSAFYFVYSNSLSKWENPEFSDSNSKLIQINHPEIQHVFLIKFNYWFTL